MMRARQESVFTLGGDHDVLRLVQVTDCHLYSEPGGTLLGMDTDNSLQKVAAQVREEREHVDILLATGDISDHGGENAYQRFASYVEPLAPHSFWITGNHDDIEAMANVAGTGSQLCGSVETLRWQMLLLNSQVPGEVGGELGPDQLDWLQQRLEASAKQSLHTLICLHHHVIPIGSAWLDEQMVADADAFWNVLDQHQHVRGVLWGHIHQEIEQRRGDVKLMATPSTCVQFAPGSKDFKADDKAPGYRWIDLHADGRIESSISRLRGVSLPVDLDAGGYLTT